VGGNSNIIHKAKLIFTGKTINSNTKSIDCYAEIMDLASLNLINNQFVEGNVIVETVAEYSLPKTAIIKSEKENYILIQDKESDKSYFFSKMKVKIGAVNQEYVELLDLPKVNKVLINGTYNIQIDWFLPQNIENTMAYLWFDTLDIIIMVA